MGPELSTEVPLLSSGGSPPFARRRSSFTSVRIVELARWSRLFVFFMVSPCLRVAAPPSSSCATSCGPWKPWTAQHPSSASLRPTNCIDACPTTLHDFEKSKSCYLGNGNDVIAQIVRIGGRASGPARRGH